jgi:hypothetical protein
MIDIVRRHCFGQKLIFANLHINLIFRESQITGDGISKDAFEGYVKGLRSRTRVVSDIDLGDADHRELLGDFLEKSILGTSDFYKLDLDDFSSFEKCKRACLYMQFLYLILGRTWKEAEIKLYKSNKGITNTLIWDLTAIGSDVIASSWELIGYWKKKSVNPGAEARKKKRNENVLATADLIRRLEVETDKIKKKRLMDDFKELAGVTTDRSYYHYRDLLRKI